MLPIFYPCALLIRLVKYVPMSSSVVCGCSHNDLGITTLILCGQAAFYGLFVVAKWHGTVHNCY